MLFFYCFAVQLKMKHEIIGTILEKIIMDIYNANDTSYSLNSWFYLLFLFYCLLYDVQIFAFYYLWGQLAKKKIFGSSALSIFFKTAHFNCWRNVNIRLYIIIYINIHIYIYTYICIHYINIDNNYIIIYNRYDSYCTTGTIIYYYHT